MTEQAQVTLEQALELAQTYHKAGNLTLAERTYLDIITAVPDDFMSLHHLGVIAYHKGTPSEGLHFIKKATEVNKESAESWNIYGIMLAVLGKNEEALLKWDKALALTPEYPEALSNKGNALWEMGRYKEAQDCCQKAVDIKPDYADGYINLGNTLTAQGLDEEGIEVWKTAIKLNPKQYKAYTNISNSLRNLGRIKEAEEYSRTSLEILPDNPDALLNLGNALNDQGQKEEALATYQRATNILPTFINAHNNITIVLMDLLRLEEAVTSAKYTLAFDANNAEAYTNLACALRMLGKLEEAEKAARQSLRLQPSSADALISLGDILSLSDRLSEAETLFNDAMEILPESAHLYLKLSSVLERTNRIEESLDAANKAVELSPEMPEAYYRKAMTYFMSNQIDEALENLNKALELQPNFPAVLSSLSEILQSEGNMKAALEAVRKGLAINDTLPALYYTLSKLKKFTTDDPDFIRMKELSAQKNSFGKSQDLSLHFALSKAYADTKDYDKSFVHLKEANDIKRSIIVFDSHAQKATFDSVIKSHTKDYLKKSEGKGFKTDVPVFIIGMPRSGTTLTEQIMASHKDVFGAGELYSLADVEKEFGYISADNCYDHGKKYLEIAQSINEESANAKRIVDKMPGNYIRMAQIITALPDAKIIHCRRNPIDTCLSCYKQFFARGHYWSYNLDDLAEHYKLYSEVMDHWRETLPEGRFLEINYEDTVNDLETQARKLIDFIGLEWDEACLTPHKSKRAILTASKGQVRKPVYKTSVEAWKRYEEQLAPLAEALAPFMQK